MSDEKRLPGDLQPDEDVEAQLLKETLGAGLAAAAIFAGTSQAAPYPVPSPPGAADATAELALIPKRSEATRKAQQVKPKAQQAKKKAVKGKKATRATADGPRGARQQTQ